MRQTTAMGTVLVAGVIACGAAWALLPTMQSSARTVESAAALPLERARRLLHEYDARLPYQAAVLEQLRDAGVDSSEPDDLSDDVLDDYQQIHERMWATFQPTDWADRPVPARTNYGAVEQQMRGGLSDRAAMIEANDALLREASAAIDEALAVSVGDASGRDLAEVLRLKATIQFYTGLSNSIRAAVLRLQTVPARSALDALIDEATDLSAAASLVADSGVEDRLADARRRLARAQAAHDGQQRALAELDRSLADIQQRIASNQAKRAQAKRDMDRLRETGMDADRSNGSSEFGQAYLSADRRLRDADRQVRYLTTGYYPAAEIDRSGDYLTGRYIENGSPYYLLVEPGLNHYNRERSVAARVLTERDREVADWQTTIVRLDDLRADYVRDQATAGDRLAAVRRKIEDALDTLNDVESGATALEETALSDLETSTRTIRDATAAADRWVLDAQQKTQNLAARNQERSAFQPRTDDQWMGGFVRAQSADAHLARAWIYYARFGAAKQNIRLFERIADIAGLDADFVAAQRDAADRAREAGVGEIKEAMADLERAHRDAGRHWTLVAQAGSTEYLLVLFGDRSYVPDTIETYRKAVENREDTAPAKPFVARLRSLEARGK